MASSPSNSPIYDRLGHERDFRLLKLSSVNTQDGSSPVVSLMTVSLDQSPEYFAVSYVWGPQEPSHTVQCAGVELKVGANLNSLLKQFLSEDCKKLLYIDRICINQDDLAEREQQVTLMGDIFGSAKAVTVWLGELNNDYKVAFETIERLLRTGLSMQMQHDYEQGTNNAGFAWPAYEEWEAEAIRQLLKADWFSRVWTFQELVLCRYAELQCGGYRFPWNGLALFLLGYRTYQPDFLGGDEEAAFEMVKSRLFITDQKKNYDPSIGAAVASLSELLCHLRNHQATDPRDKIFALLNVANDVSPGDILPDYEQSHLELYAKTVKWLLRKHRSLSFLSMVEKKDKPDLVSWVPDFRAKDAMNFSHQPHILFTGGDGTWWSASGTSPAMQSNEPVPLLYLPVRTICVGKIIARTEPPGNNMGNIGSRALNGGEWHLFAESTTQNGVYQHTGEPIDLAFHRLRVWDTLPGEGKLRRHRSKQLTMIDYKNPHLIQYDDTVNDARFIGHRDDIATRIYNGTTRKRMFRTDTGYIGLARRCLELGDEIHIFFGFNVPCVLRKLGGRFYTFGGEAYVHGLMDGELLLRESGRVAPDAPINGISPEDRNWLNSLADLDTKTAFPKSESIVLV